MSIVHRSVISAVLLSTAAVLSASQVSAEGVKESRGDSERTAGQGLSPAQSLGVAETASGGEVELSSVASSKARSPAVQKLAQTIINDHSEAGQKARALAEKLRVRVTPSATSNALQKEADDATARVDKVTGPPFDRAYVEGTIRFHQKVLNAIDEALPNVGAKEVKELFNDVRARVEHELDVAKTTLASLSK